MKQFGRYVVKVQLRETVDGRQLKPRVRELLDGETLFVMAAWMMDESEPYDGEMALVPIDRPSSIAMFEAGITWLASGDVQEQATPCRPNIEGQTVAR